MGARPNIPGPGRTVIALFGLINAPHQRFLEISRMVLGSAHRYTVDKTCHIHFYTFSFIYYHCASLVNGLVNSGSHIKVTLSIWFLVAYAQDTEFSELLD